MLALRPMLQTAGRLLRGPRGGLVPSLSARALSSYTTGASNARAETKQATFEVSCPDSVGLAAQRLGLF